MPQSAFFSAGVVIHAVARHGRRCGRVFVKRPRCEICVRETLGQSHRPSQWILKLAALSCFFESPSCSRPKCFAPKSNFFAVSCAMASASARDHFNLHAHLPGAVAMVALASSRGGSNSGNTANKLPLPVAFSARHAQRTKATRRKFVHRLFNFGFHLPRIGR